MTPADGQPPDGGAGQSPPGSAGQQAQPSEAELRQQLEEQLRKVRVQDVLLESVASVLNLSARRITKADERDLEQARVGIEAGRALVELLEPQAREQVRHALSELQMLYAREASGEGAAPSEAPEADAAGAPETEPPPRRRGEPPPKLWTPPGSS